MCLTDLLDNWLQVPTNTTLTVHNQTISIKEIKDEYWDPGAERSQEFASEHGLVTKAPGGLSTPLTSEIQTPSEPPLADVKSFSLVKDTLNEIHTKSRFSVQA